MIPEFIRCVREAQPRAFIMENVKGLTRESFRSYFSYTILQLTYPDVLRKSDESWNTHLSRLESIHTHGGTCGLTYNVVYRVLNAADYGVSQTRERVFIVGFRSDLNRSWHFPDPTHSKESMLHDQWVTGEYWQRQRSPPYLPQSGCACLSCRQEISSDLPLGRQYAAPSRISLIRRRTITQRCSITGCKWGPDPIQAILVVPLMLHQRP
jgi:site-specific DNA-cytosine methylase